MTNKRILLIEDEFLIALEFRSQLAKAGFSDVAHVATEQDALKQIREGNWDAAIADANLNGRKIGEVAAALNECHIPFVIVTGYGRESLPAELTHIPLIPKPVDSLRLVQEVARLCSIGETNVAPPSKL